MSEQRRQQANDKSASNEVDSIVEASITESSSNVHQENYQIQPPHLLQTPSILSSIESLDNQNCHQEQPPHLLQTPTIASANESLDLFYSFKRFFF